MRNQQNCEGGNVSLITLALDYRVAWTYSRYQKELKKKSKYKAIQFVINQNLVLSRPLTLISPLRKNIQRYVFFKREN